MTFKIPEPELQVSFSRSLTEIREIMLQESLGETVRQIHIPTLDKQLAEIVPPQSLSTLASHGLRGELVFATPILLEKNPRLLGYYRLLYGFSQKEFYKKGIGSQFKSLETSGTLTRRNTLELSGFCQAMAQAGSILLAGISTGNVSAALLDDLTLLTLGPQLRGGMNVKIGTAAIAAVFGVIKNIVSSSIIKTDHNHIELGAVVAKPK